MRIGVSGHQDRQGIDWTWVSVQVTAFLTAELPVSKAYTSLAIGADQVFARAAFDLDIPVVAVVPLAGYERFFSSENLGNYLSLLAKSDAIELDGNDDPQQAFMAAGRFIADQSDKLIVIWDEKPAKGLGGTADIVEYAVKTGKPVFLINPHTQTARTI